MAVWYRRTGGPPDNVPPGPGGPRGGVALKRARAPDRPRPLPRVQGYSVIRKLQRNEVHTRQNTRDHDPRRIDQCNIHTHVIVPDNKSPVEKVLHYH